MSRASRFDKLEGERDAAEAPSSGASLERFGAEPELSERAAPVDAMQPESGFERLRRFDADGSEGLGLDRDPLSVLPMLECPACSTACGKFERVCHACRAPLTSPEALAHNHARLEALLAQRAHELTAARARREAEQQEAEADRMLRQSADLALGRALGPSAAGTWGGWIAAAVLLGLGALVSSFGFKLLFFSLAAICLMTRVPRAVWLKLGEKARIRQR